MPVSRCFRQGTDQSRRTATPSHGHKKPDRGYVYYNAPFDLAEQLRLDSLEATGLRNGFRFAYKFVTDYTPENSGVHFTLSDGTKVWRLGIRSKVRSPSI